MNQAILHNEEIGAPVYQGLMLGGHHTGTPLLKADYPGLRAIRIGGTITLVEDLPDSYTVPAGGVDRAWGVVDSKTVTANQTGISTADVTGLTSTFTAVAGRRYRLSALVRTTQVTTAANQVCRITDGSNNGLVAVQQTMAINAVAAHTLFVTVAPGAGLVTYKVRLEVSAGTGTVQASAVAPALFTVEDVGPATPASRAELWY